MNATLFNAPEYDAAKERRKRNRWIILIAALLIVGGVAWHFRYWSYVHEADQFYSALQAKQYEKAFGIWNHDPQWQQHPYDYKKYPFGQFYLDWGPAGEYSQVNEYKIDDWEAKGSGVIVFATLNQRTKPSVIWVDRKDKKISYPSPWVVPQ